MEKHRANHIRKYFNIIALQVTAFLFMGANEVDISQDFLKTVAIPISVSYFFFRERNTKPITLFCQYTCHVTIVFTILQFHIKT